jgi:hypothetical protein
VPTPYAPPLALFTPTHPHPHTHSPQEPPVLNVLIPVTHPAVDPIGRVRTGAVSAWVYGSSQLVAAVSEALAVLGAKVVDTGRAAGGWGWTQAGQQVGGWGWGGWATLRGAWLGGMCCTEDNASSHMLCCISNV